MKKRIIYALSSLALLTVMIVGAKNTIMKIEMKDGTVKYVNADVVDKFDFIDREEMPVVPEAEKLTEPLWDTGTVWYHPGFLDTVEFSVSLMRTYVPDDPTDNIYRLSGGIFKKDIVFVEDENGTVTLDCQPTGYVHPEYGEIWIADRRNYTTKVLGEKYYGKRCPEFQDYKRRLNLDCVYYAPGDGDGTKFAEYVEDLLIRGDRQPLNIIASADTTANRLMKIDFKGGFDRPVNVRGSYIIREIDWNSTTYKSDVDRLKYEVSWKYDHGDYDFSLDSSAGQLFISIPEGENMTVCLKVSYIDEADSDETHRNETEWVKSFDAVMSNPGVGGVFYSNSPSIGVTNTSLRRLSPLDQTKDVKYIMDGIFGLSDTLIVPDMDARTPEGYVPITLPGKYTGYNGLPEGRIYRSDARWMYRYYAGREEDDPIFTQLKHNQFDPYTNAIRLYTVQYYPEYKDGKYCRGIYTETFVADDSFNPFASVIETTTDMTADKEHVTVIARPLQKNVPAAYYRIGFSTDSINAIVSDFTSNPEKYPVCKADGDAVSATFGFEKKKAYNVVSVAYDKNDREIGRATDLFVAPIDIDQWDFLGQGEMYDGWVLPTYINMSTGKYIDPMAYPMKVNYYQHKKYPYRYLIQSPWVNSFMAPKNLTPEEALADHLEFMIRDGVIIIPDQPSGFTPGSKMIIVANEEGFHYTSAPWTLPKDIIQEMIRWGHEDNISSYEDGIITIPAPYIGYGNSTGRKSPCPAYLVLPEAFESAAAEKVRLKVARTVKTLKAVKKNDPEPLRNYTDDSLLEYTDSDRFAPVE